MTGTKDAGHSVTAEAMMVIIKVGNTANDSVCEILTKF
jgi:hypothetical protein